MKRFSGFVNFPIWKKKHLVLENWNWILLVVVWPSTNSRKNSNILANWSLTVYRKTASVEGHERTDRAVIVNNSYEKPTQQQQRTINTHPSLSSWNAKYCKWKLPNEKQNNKTKNNNLFHEYPGQALGSLKSAERERSDPMFSNRVIDFHEKGRGSFSGGACDANEVSWTIRSIDLYLLML